MFCTHTGSKLNRVQNVFVINSYNFWLMIGKLTQGVPVDVERAAVAGSKPAGSELVTASSWDTLYYFVYGRHTTRPWPAVVISTLSILTDDTRYACAKN